MVGIRCGTLGFWLLLGATGLVLLCYSQGVGAYLRHEYRSRMRADFKFLPTDMAYNTCNTLGVPFACILAGMAAGFLGIGGGMVKVTGVVGVRALAVARSHFSQGSYYAPYPRRGSLQDAPAPRRLRYVLLYDHLHVILHHHPVRMAFCCS